MNQHPKAVEMGEDCGFRREEPGHQSPGLLRNYKAGKGSQQSLLAPSVSC